MCELCNAKVYVKNSKDNERYISTSYTYRRIRQELEDLTGERYLEVKANYCLMCGSKLT